MKIFVDGKKVKVKINNVPVKLSQINDIKDPEIPPYEPPDYLAKVCLAIVNISYVGGKE